MLIIKCGLQMHCNSFFLLLFSLMVMACSDVAHDGRTNEQREKMKAIQSELANVISTSNQVDIAAGDRLIDQIAQYTNAYREDSMSAVFLLDGAQLCASMGKYQKAIQWLMNYSEHPKASQLDYATFLVGYEYDAHLKQPMTAEKYYRAVIEKYPESQWAKSANQSLQWLGLSDDEIFKKLEEINAPLP